jgi:8-oxo-dGTP pyrophosphatase MutT (NUDIX family)
MKNITWRRRFANLLKKMPWLIITARALYRIGRARFSAGVVGVVLNGEGHVLLVEHVFHPQNPWGLPGGWIENYEDPADALRRELREELQLKIEVSIVLLAELGYGNHLDFAYLCQPIGTIGKLSEELLDYRWVSVDELPRMLPFHYRAIMRAVETTAGEKIG